MYAGTKGFLDDVAVEDIAEYEREFYRFLESKQSGVLKELADKKELDDELQVSIENALKEFSELRKNEAA